MTVITTKPYEWINTYWRYRYENGPLIEIRRQPTSRDLSFPVIKDLNSNPNWKSDIAYRRDASRPYRNCGFEASVPLYYWANYVRGRYPYRTFGYVRESHPFIHKVVEPYDDALRDIALSRLKRKLASHTKEMQGIVPLVEIRELRDLIKYLTQQTTDFALGLLSILKHPLSSRGYSKLGKTVFDFRISEAWLAYSFAIKPTLSDIDSAVSAIQNYLGDPPRSLVLRGTSKKKWVTSLKFNSTTSDFVNHRCYLANTVMCEHSLTYTYVGGFDINLLSSNSYNPPGQSYNLAGFLNQFGLTPEKLLGSAWELIPFSWLLDYFGTIGAFLDDAFESSAGNTRYCTLSRKYNVMVDRSAEPLGDGDTRISDYKVFGGLYHYYDFQRSVHAQLPHRSLRFKTVDEIGINGVNRLLNLLAVLASGSGRPTRG